MFCIGKFLCTMCLTQNLVSLFLEQFTIKNLKIWGFIRPPCSIGQEICHLVIRSNQGTFNVLLRCFAQASLNVPCAYTRNRIYFGQFTINNLKIWGFIQPPCFVGSLRSVSFSKEAMREHLMFCCVVLHLQASFNVPCALLRIYFLQNNPDQS